MTARDRVAGWSYAAAWRLIRLMPARGAAALFRAGADRAARKRGAGVRRLEVNLRVVVGPDLAQDQFDLLVRDAMRSYARYWLEAFRLPSRTREQHRAGFRLGGAEVLGAHVAAGQGAILALPHGGNWDAAGAWVAANGWPIVTVVERLKPEAVYRRFLAFREGLGMEILPLTGGERPILSVLAERVRAGAVVPLLADRDLSGGVEVEFFGQVTKMPPGPAILALRTGAPLYVVDMWFEPDGPVGQMSGPLPVPDAGRFGDRVRALTQAMAAELEAGVRRHPRDWHMLAPMFDPAPTPAPTPAPGTVPTPTPTPAPTPSARER